MTSRWWWYGLAAFVVALFVLLCAELARADAPSWRLSECSDTLRMCEADLESCERRRIGEARKVVTATRAIDLGAQCPPPPICPAIPPPAECSCFMPALPWVAASALAGLLVGERLCQAPPAVVIAP